MTALRSLARWLFTPSTDGLCERVADSGWWVDWRDPLMPLITVGEARGVSIRRGKGR